MKEILALTGPVNPTEAADLVRRLAPPTRQWHSVESAIRATRDDPAALHEIGQSLGRYAHEVAQKSGPRQEAAAALAVEKAIVDALDRPTDGYYGRARAELHGRAASSARPMPADGVRPVSAKPVYAIPAPPKGIGSPVAPAKLPLMKPPVGKGAIR
ncbi:MAG: hypothetical protein KIS96_10925 [Bauldia sp.]|nr:hypothetical protein [Bauldia sp.]